MVKGARYRFGFPVIGRCALPVDTVQLAGHVWKAVVESAAMLSNDAHAGMTSIAAAGPDAVAWFRVGIATGTTTPSGRVPVRG